MTDQGGEAKAATVVMMTWWGREDTWLAVTGGLERERAGEESACHGFSEEFRF